MPTHPAVRSLMVFAWPVSIAGTDAGMKDREGLKCLLAAIPPNVNATAGTSERLLIAAAELHVKFGPSGGVAGMLGLAVKFCAEEYAAESSPGSAGSRPEHWYEKGGMA